MIARRALAAAAGLFAVIGGAAAPATASADCCVGPWVSVTAPYNAPLAATIRLTIAQDTPELRFSAKVRPLLLVGSKRIHRFPAFNVRDVSPAKQYRTLVVPRATRDAAAAYGARTGHRRAVLKFVIADATNMATGETMRDYGMDSFLMLPRHGSK